MTGTDPLHIYVAGSSKDIDRCERAVARCREAGFTITEDWVAEMRASAPDSALDTDRLKACALADLRGVETADVVWLLAPPASKPSAGDMPPCRSWRVTDIKRNAAVVAHVQTGAEVRVPLAPDLLALIKVGDVLDLDDRPGIVEDVTTAYLQKLAAKPLPWSVGDSVRFRDSMGQPAVGKLDCVAATYVSIRTDDRHFIRLYTEIERVVPPPATGGVKINIHETEPEFPFPPSQGILARGFKPDDHVRVVRESRHLLRPGEPEIMVVAKIADDGLVEMTYVAVGGPALWAPEHLEIVESNATCARCGAGAFEGLLSITCQRPGGCRTLDERIGEPIVHDIHSSPTAYLAAPGDADVHNHTVANASFERCWMVQERGASCAKGSMYATQALAIEAWKARRREEELNPRVVVNLSGPAPMRESIDMARLLAAYAPYLKS